MFGRYNPNAGHGNHICGIFYNLNAKRIYLPQVELASHTTINPLCYTTQLRQTFQNTNDEALSKVQYAFPLYDGVAVSSYTIRYADKVLRGVVQQKEDAKQTYQAAIDRGETAGLLESLPAGIFGVTLGNVPANTAIIVELTYCGELKHDAAIDGLRYNLPTSIAPRYGAYPGELLTTTNAVARKGISITVDLDMANSAIRKVQSPSHPISVSMGATSKTVSDGSTFQPSQASASLALGTTELGGDFILQILIDDLSKPQAIVETHPSLPNQRAVMATLVPKFNLQSGNPEIVFIADQSGSMGGSKNTALVSALRVFIKSLPFGVRFNICAFGSSFKFLWPKSQAYSEANVKAALSFVDSFTASYGGTEILQPITAAFKQRLKDLPLEVMLLTDGEVWGEQDVFAFVNRQISDEAVDARVFALGIGNDVSHSLVEGVARAGNGFAQFVTQNEDTDQKVIRMLKGALFAHTKDYEMEVHYAEESTEKKDDEDFEIIEKVEDCLKIDDSDSKSVLSATETLKETAPMSFFDTSNKPPPANEKADRYAHLPSIGTPKLLQAPTTIPPLFPFNRTTVYLLLGPESAQKQIHSVTLRATSAQGPLELNVPVSRTDATGGQGSIHILAARKAIQELEEGRGWITKASTSEGAAVRTKYESRLDEIAEREGVRLGEKFQVASKWTSFVAVQDHAEIGKSEVDERYVVRDDMTLYSNPAVAVPGLFGNSSQQGGNLFRGSEFSRATADGLYAPAPRTTAQSGGLFGNAASTSTSGHWFGGSGAPSKQNHHSAGGLFGQAPFTAPQADSLFASTASTTGSSSCFGANAVQPGYNPPPASGGLFGGSFNPSGSLFGSGNTAGSSAFEANHNTSGALFGNGTGVSLFGGLNEGFTPKDGAAEGTTLFGNGDFSASSRVLEDPSIFGSDGALFENNQDNGPKANINNADETSAAAAVATKEETASLPDKKPMLTSTSHSANPIPTSTSKPVPTLSISSTSGSSPRVRLPEKKTSGGRSASYSAPVLYDEEDAPSSHEATLASPSILERGEKLDSVGSSHDLARMSFSAIAPASYGAPPPPPAPSGGAPPPPAARMSAPSASARGGNVELSKSIAHARAAPSFASRVASSVKSSFSGGGGVPAFAARKSAAAPPPSAQPLRQQQQKQERTQDPLHALIALQSFLGSWTLDAEFLSLLGISPPSDGEKVSIAGEDVKQDQDTVVATALALAFLENRFAGKREVWEMVGEKARAWMAGMKEGRDVEGIVGRAREILEGKMGD